MSSPPELRYLSEQSDAVQRDANQVFFWLLLGEWLFGVGLALTVSPYAWAGRTRMIHTHVWTALLFGAALDVLPLLMIRTHPNARVTPHVVAVAQMLWSALLIELSGGRIETHFHVFGSLAFLAFYRDRAVLLTATAVVALDHFVRGLYWPDAVYGVENPEWWRFLEHAFWVVFEVIVLSLGVARQRREMAVLAQHSASLSEVNARVEETVAVRTRELNEAVERYRALVENTNALPWVLEPETWNLLYIAPQAQRFFGARPEDLTTERLLELVHPDDIDRLRTHLQNAFAGKAPDNDVVDYRMITRDKRMIHVRTTLGAYSAGRALSGITMDITKQVKLEGELRQAQKLESVGKLAAGVAHEINTPVQFVSDSLYFVQSACVDLRTMLARHRAGDHTGAAELARQVDYEYVEKQLPRAIELALDGLGRVAGIVRSMKEFAYPQTEAMVEVDLNRAIQSTLTIARGEYKYVADLETELAELPRVRCHVSDINQVVLNLVVNAAHAIEGRVRDGDKGRIWVRTWREADAVVIAIEDTGGGVPEHLHERIFEPFFTTKDVGRGTGQGLSIARTIVVERHRGALWFESRSGVGTTFFVRLPIHGEPIVQEPAA